MFIPTWRQRLHWPDDIKDIFLCHSAGAWWLISDGLFEFLILCQQMFAQLHHVGVVLQHSRLVKLMKRCHTPNAHLMKHLLHDILKQQVCVAGQHWYQVKVIQLTSSISRNPYLIFGNMLAWELSTHACLVKVINCHHAPYLHLVDTCFTSSSDKMFVSERSTHGSQGSFMLTPTIPTSQNICPMSWNSILCTHLAFYPYLEEGQDAFLMKTQQQHHADIKLALVKHP